MTIADPASPTARPLAPPRYRPLGLCLLAGALGAAAAIAFDALVELAGRLFLAGIGGFAHRSRAPSTPRSCCRRGASAGGCRW